MFADLRQLQELYGPDAGHLYHQAAGENAAARAKYDQAMDTYFRANQAAAYGTAGMQPGVSLWLRQGLPSLALPSL